MRHGGRPSRPSRSRAMSYRRQPPNSTRHEGFEPLITSIVRLSKICNTVGMALDPSLLASAGTHVVTNQVPTLEDYNAATSPVLAEALIREGGEWGIDE